MKSGWEDHKSQRNKKLAVKLCLLYITGTYNYEILTSSSPTQKKNQLTWQYGWQKSHKAQCQDEELWEMKYLLGMGRISLLQEQPPDRLSNLKWSY